MRISRHRDGTLEVRESPILLRAALLAGAVVIPWATLDQPRAYDPLSVAFGLLGGAFCLLSAALVESRWFRFEPLPRRILWRRSSMLRRRGGAISFDEVSDVVAQARIDDRSSHRRRPTYRPVLVTATDDFPLSNTSSSAPEHYEDLLTSVRNVLGLRNADPRGQVLDVARAGRVLEAVTLLRRQSGDSLEVARARVEEMLSGKGAAADLGEGSQAR